MPLKEAHMLGVLFEVLCVTVIILASPACTGAQPTNESCASVIVNPARGMMNSNGISGKRFSTHISPTIQCAEHPDHFGDFLKRLVL
jgi:hypothetical protein